MKSFEIIYGFKFEIWNEWIMYWSIILKLYLWIELLNKKWYKNSSTNLKIICFQNSMYIRLHLSLSIDNVLVWKILKIILIWLFETIWYCIDLEISSYLYESFPYVVLKFMNTYYDITAFVSPSESFLAPKISSHEIFHCKFLYFIHFFVTSIFNFRMKIICIDDTFTFFVGMEIGRSWSINFFLVTPKSCNIPKLKKETLINTS